MSKNTSMSLSPHFDDFIEALITQCRYGSASEVVRAGLRLLEDEETRLSALRSALAVGERSGFAEHFDFDEFVQSKRSRPDRKMPA